MTRRELREHCFKMLFSVDFYTTGEVSQSTDAAVFSVSRGG